MWRRQWIWCVRLGTSLGDTPTQPMGGGWLARETITMWSSAGGWRVGSVEWSWMQHTHRPTYRNSMSGNDRPVQYRSHCLFLCLRNNGRPYCGRPHPLTAWLRAFHGGRPAASTSGCISCTWTCGTPLWSSTRFLASTPGAINVACSYPGRRWCRDTSAPQCERGVWN